MVDLLFLIGLLIFSQILFKSGVSENIVAAIGFGTIGLLAIVLRNFNARGVVYYEGDYAVFLGVLFLGVSGMAIVAECRSRKKKRQSAEKEDADRPTKT